MYIIATNAINEVVASQEGLSKPLPVAKQRTPSKQRFKEDTAESEIQAMQSDVIQAVTALLQQSQDVRVDCFMFCTKYIL